MQANKPTHSKASALKVLEHYTLRERQTREGYGVPMQEAAQQMYNDLLALVGEDEDWQSIDGDVNEDRIPRNQLRAELRTALRKYFGVEYE